MNANMINTISKRISMGLLVLAILLALTANYQAVAQSGTATNPTPIKGNEVRGDLFANDEEYFFSFLAEAGEIGVSLDVQATSGNAGLTLELSDSNGRNLAPVMLVQGLNRGSDSAQRKIQIAGRQTILIRLKDIRYNLSGCRGNFVIRLNGASRAEPSSAAGALGQSSPGSIQQGSIQQGSIQQGNIQQGNNQQNSNQDAGAKEYPYLPQSTNAMQPTMLDRSSFSGELAGRGNEFFYSFAVNPGDLTLTVGVIAETNQAEAIIDLLDARATPLLTNLQIRGTDQGASESRTVRFSQRQMVTLRIKDVTGSKGLFLVALDGAVDASQINGAPMPAPEGSLGGGRADDRSTQPAPPARDGRSQFQITFGTRKHGNITLSFDLKEELLQKLLNRRKDLRR